MANWGYTGDKAPCHWGENYPHAKGNRQSPIDIVTKDVKVDASLGPLNVDYGTVKCSNIVNNGFTFQVNVECSDANLSGGPLAHKYRLAQFHCHWGSKDGQGSEHTVDGKAYDAELHLVHWNTDLFKSVGDALPQDKGLTVLTTFLKVGKASPGWEQLNTFLAKIKNKDDTCCVEGGFNPTVLLPENKNDYWTYEGSLTTPPCYESPRFVIYREPVEISPEQMKTLRDMLSFKQGGHAECGCPEHLGDNYRPTMPLNGRVVAASFQA